ncbi:hypothetical protein AOLI_G00298830 [Acnodon oligacanthus]
MKLSPGLKPASTRRNPQPVTTTLHRTSSAHHPSGFDFESVLPLSDHRVWRPTDTVKDPNRPWAKLSSQSSSHDAQRCGQVLRSHSDSAFRTRNLCCSVMNSGLKKCLGNWVVPQLPWESSDSSDGHSSDILVKPEDSVNPLADQQRVEGAGGAEGPEGVLKDFSMTVCCSPGAAEQGSQC